MDRWRMACNAITHPQGPTMTTILQINTSLFGAIDQQVIAAQARFTRD